jgi:hypothetical protein
MGYVTLNSLSHSRSVSFRLRDDSEEKPRGEPLPRGGICQLKETSTEAARVFGSASPTAINQMNPGNRTRGMRNSVFGINKCSQLNPPPRPDTSPTRLPTSVGVS